MISTLTVMLPLVVCLLVGGEAQADVEWETLKQLRIKGKPLDIDVSSDGQDLFILTQGELIIYSLTEAKAKYAITVNSAFDSLRLDDTHQSVILLSRTEKLIEIIQLF